MPVLQSSASTPHTIISTYPHPILSCAALFFLIFCAVLMRQCIIRSRDIMASSSNSLSSPRQPTEKSEGGKPDFAQYEKRPYAPPQPWEKVQASWTPPPPPRPTLQLEHNLNLIAKELQFGSQSRPAPTPPTANIGLGFSEDFGQEFGQNFGDEKEVVGTGMEDANADAEFPIRRRSYTKVVDGSPMQGEVMSSPIESWTRHTRVYGGGVCLACLESEEKMKA